MSITADIKEFARDKDNQAGPVKKWLILGGKNE